MTKQAPTRYGYFPLGCGDTVRENEGRHEGTVLAILNGTVRVLWPNGWRSDFTVDELTLVERVSYRR